ncbi:MAG: hypothetical protein IKM95_00985 [Bacteroidales bacterium]|nr:hypothetical protein [Bacteroidales bacterium]
MIFNWIDGYKINVAIDGNNVVITANKEGLLSLANHLKTLAEEPTNGAHFHLDEYNSLEDGSVALIVDKIPS